MGDRTNSSRRATRDIVDSQASARITRTPDRAADICPDMPAQPHANADSTPLVWAEHRGKADVARVLREHGARR